MENTPTHQRNIIEIVNPQLETVFNQPAEESNAIQRVDSNVESLTRENQTA